MIRNAPACENQSPWVFCRYSRRPVSCWCERRSSILIRLGPFALETTATCQETADFFKKTIGKSPSSFWKMLPSLPSWRANRNQTKWTQLKHGIQVRPYRIRQSKRTTPFRYHIEFRLWRHLSVHIGRTVHSQERSSKQQRPMPSAEQWPNSTSANRWYPKRSTVIRSYPSCRRERSIN